MILSMVLAHFSFLFIRVKLSVASKLLGDLDSQLFQIALVNGSFGNPKDICFSQSSHHADIIKCTFNFPCDTPHTCTPYLLTLPPGKYLFELYGASGGYDTVNYPSLAKDPKNCGQCLLSEETVRQYGGNAYCHPSDSQAGAGGYTRGFLTLKKDTTAFISTGGVGEIGFTSDHSLKGGWNGGGNGRCNDQWYGSAGGGATDLRLLQNDVFHRVLVSGAGGGSDDTFPGRECGKENDGSGGAGGGEEAQGPWEDGVSPSASSSASNSTSQTEPATQKNGFSFGQAQNVPPNAYVTEAGTKMDRDYGGGGSGWYGGFFGNPQVSSGGGGGSSYALTKTSYIPENEIVVVDGNGDEKKRGFYAFNNASPYCFLDTLMLQGIWVGNGKAAMTYWPDYTSAFKLKNASIKTLTSTIRFFFFSLFKLPSQMLK